LILNTELSANIKLPATASLAESVLRYSFGIINYYQEEMQKLDRKTRKIANHPWTASSKSRH
jgi:hypothetical protein